VKVLPALSPRPSEGEGGGEGKIKGIEKRFLRLYQNVRFDCEELKSEVI